MEEQIKTVKVENDACLKQKDDKINSMEEEIVKVNFLWSIIW